MIGHHLSFHCLPMAPAHRGDTLLHEFLECLHRGNNQAPVVGDRCRPSDPRPVFLDCQVFLPLFSAFDSVRSVFFVFLRLCPVDGVVRAEGLLGVS